jgi:hypothetical protein
MNYQVLVLDPMLYTQSWNEDKATLMGYNALSTDQRVYGFETNNLQLTLDRPVTGIKNISVISVSVPNFFAMGDWPIDGHEGLYHMEITLSDIDLAGNLVMHVDNILFNWSNGDNYGDRNNIITSINNAIIAQSGNAPIITISLENQDEFHRNELRVKIAPAALVIANNLGGNIFIEMDDWIAFNLGFNTNKFHFAVTQQNLWGDCDFTYDEDFYSFSHIYYCVEPIDNRDNFNLCKTCTDDKVFGDIPWGQVNSINGTFGPPFVLYVPPVEAPVFFTQPIQFTGVRVSFWFVSVGRWFRFHFGGKPWHIDLKLGF